MKGIELKSAFFMKNKFSWKSKITFTIIFFSLFISCSTEKNTTLSVAYHNMTARFNVHFNGFQSYLKGMNKIEESQEFDYSFILPIYLVADDNTIGAISPDMDRTQKKAMKVIEMHSIKAKPEYKKSSLTPKQRDYLKKNEYNKWVDDNYLLIGKTYFYQTNYKLALETFRFVLREFEDEPKVIYEAKLWMTKSYIQLENYKEVIALLNDLDDEKNTDAKLKAKFNAVYAQYLIYQEDYAGAIPRLRWALKKPGSKANKMRYTYILAQLYQKTGKNNMAYDTYKKVIAMNPPYEMTFNAKINMAGSFEKGYASSQDIKDQLNKMLKDDKNIDYKDQIYYAYGNIELKEGNQAEAINNYIKSAYYSTNNDKQKAKSYLILADLYYEMPNYMKAQSYYDSSFVLLPTDYPGYGIIEAKSKNLTDLVKSIRSVELQDSVQHLATLTNKERLSIIDGIIDDLERKEREAQLEEQRRTQEMQLARSMNVGMNTNSGGWYFYNTTTKTLGVKEFKGKWGNRKLEDNWRRKNKSIMDSELSNLDNNQESEQNEKVNQLSNKSREYYLENIPLTDSAMEASHETIKESLVNIGLIYKNQFHETELSVEAFEDLIRRYPNDDITLNAYYNLYLVYRNNNNTKSEKYKNIIISSYPDSKFAKALTDPEYYKEIEKQEREAPLFYEKTLALFQQGNYAQVIQNADFALYKYKNPELVPKFKYLKTMSIGSSSDAGTFRKALNTFINDPKNGDLIPVAKKTLAFLDADKPEVMYEQEIEKAQEIYNANPNLEHFLIVSITNDANIRQLIFNFQEFNLYNFDDLNLSVSREKLSDGTALVKVSSFKDQMAIMQYYDIIRESQEIFKDVEKSDSRIFFISSENYAVLQQDQKLDRFLLFFNKNFR